MSSYLIKLIMKRIVAQAKTLFSVAGLYFISAVTVNVFVVYLQGGIVSYLSNNKRYQNNNYYFNDNIAREIKYGKPEFDYQFLNLNCTDCNYNVYQNIYGFNEHFNYNIYKTTEKFRDYGIIYEYDKNTLPILLNITKSESINSQLKEKYLIINKEMSDLMIKHNISNLIIEEEQFAIKEVVEFDYANINTPSKKYSDAEYKKPIAILITTEFDYISDLIWHGEIPESIKTHYSLKDKLDMEKFNGKNIKAFFNKRHQGTFIFFNLATLVPIIIMYFGITANFNYIIEKRSKEIAIKKINGAKFSDIFKEFLFEGILIAMVFSIIGIIVGIICGNIALKASMLNYYLNWASVIFIFLAIIILGILSSFIVSKKAYSTNVLKAIKEN